MIVIILEVLLWFALYPAIWWFVLKYLFEEYPVLNYLKLLIIPLGITIAILLFALLRDSTRFVVVFLIEGPNESKWLAEQGPKISRLLFWTWLLMPITVRLVSLTNGRDYKVLKRHVKQIRKKVTQVTEPEKPVRKTKKHKKSKKK